AAPGGAGGTADARAGGGQSGAAATSGTADTGAGAGSAADQGTAGTGASGTAQTEASARTPAEQRAEIDRRLAASIEQFDAQLQREQAQTAQQRDARAAGGGAGANAEDAMDRYGSDRADDTLARNRAGDLRSEGAGGGARTGDGPGAIPGAAGAGGSGPAGSGGVSAREIPAGDDDDIIARRLRKAAESETDPELKDKLWKEYIDYKANTQKGG